MFLLTWAEIGIIGLLALVALLARYMRLLFAARDLPEEAAVLGVASGCVALSLIVHFQVDVTWTRGTSSLAFAMMGLMLAAERLSLARGYEGVPTPNRSRTLGRVPTPAKVA
jgi:hypothetical protein